MYGFDNGMGFNHREYLSDFVFFAVDMNKPHIGSLVFDSNEAPGDRVLRSEVDHAMTMIKHRLEKGRHTNHHTKPVIMYTLERDAHARITQAHFDSKIGKIVLRQSRQLDHRGPEPTRDAFILLRWMANRPVGEIENIGEDGKIEDGRALNRDEEGTGPRLIVGFA